MPNTISKRLGNKVAPSVDDSRSSYLHNGGTINGLRAHPASKKDSRPRKGRDDIPSFDNEAKLAGQISALRTVVTQENETKDKLVEILTKRCSRAEARVDELQMQMARLERTAESARHLAVQLERNRDTVGKEAEETAQQLAILGEDLVFERTKVDEQQKNINQLEKALRDQQKLNKELEHESHQRTMHFNETVSQLTQKIDALQTQLNEQNVWQQQINQSSNQASAQALQYRNEYEAIKEKYLQLQKVAERDRAAITRLEDQRHRFGKSLDAQRSRVTNLEAAILSLRHREQSLQEELKAAVESGSGAREKRLEFHEKTSRLKRQLQHREKRSSVLEGKVERLETALKEKEIALDQAEKGHAKLLETHRLLKQRYRYLEETLKEERENSMNQTLGSTDTDVRVEHAEEPNRLSKASIVSKQSSEKPQGVQAQGNEPKRTGLVASQAMQHDRPLSNNEPIASAPALLHQQQPQQSKNLPRRSSRIPLPRRRGKYSQKSTKVNISKIPDPAQAPDSDAPDWVKF